MWLRRVKVVGSCERCDELSGSIRWGGIALLAEELAAFYEGL